MRAVVALLVLAACDFRPAPRREPPAPKAATPADAGAVAPRPPPTGDPCVDVGAHVGELWVATATDAAQKALYEQERTKTVRKTADVCTRDAWSEMARTCYLKAEKWLDLQGCAGLLKH